MTLITCNQKVIHIWIRAISNCSSWFKIWSGFKKVTKKRNRKFSSSRLFATGHATCNAPISRNQNKLANLSGTRWMTRGPDPDQLRTWKRGKNQCPTVQFEDWKLFCFRGMFRDNSRSLLSKLTLKKKQKSWARAQTINRCTFTPNQLTSLLKLLQLAS